MVRRMIKTAQRSQSALFDAILACLEATSKALHLILKNGTLLLIPKYSSSISLANHMNAIVRIDKCLKMNMISTDSAMFYNGINDSKSVLSNLETLTDDVLPTLSQLLAELMTDLTEFLENSYITDTKSIVELLKMRRLANVVSTIQDFVAPKFHTILIKCKKFSTSFNSCEYFDLKNYQNDSVLITDLIEDDDFHYDDEFDNLEMGLELLLLESDLGDNGAVPFDDCYGEDVFELDLEPECHQILKPAVSFQLHNRLNLNKLITIC